MVRGNLKIARRAYEAFASKDYESALAFAAPDVRYEFAGRFAEGSDFEGAAAIRKLWEGLDMAFREWRSEPEEIIEVDSDRVLVLARETGVGRASGLEFSERLAHLMTFREGKIVRFEVFTSRRQALEAAGLTKVVP
jgi:ketosteroid isomerase-like protein